MSEKDTNQEYTQIVKNTAVAMLLATAALAGCSETPSDVLPEPSLTAVSTTTEAPAPIPEIETGVEGIEQIRTDMLAYTQDLALLIDANAQEQGVDLQLSGDPNTTIYEFTKQGSDETLEIIIGKSAINYQVESLSIARFDTPNKTGGVISSRITISPLAESGVLAELSRETTTVTPAPITSDESRVYVSDSQTAERETLRSWKQDGTSIKIGGVDGGEIKPANPESYGNMMNALVPLIAQDLSNFSITP